MCAQKLKRIFLLLYCIHLLSGNAIAQYAYFGHTNDLATDAPLKNVLVFHKRLGIQKLSDNNGAFVFDFDNPKIQHKYQILHNLFFAPPNTDVELSIYNSIGVSIVKSVKVSKGRSCSCHI